MAIVNTRILGIDPGLRLTGFGVIEKRGEKIIYIASGTIKTASGKKNKVEGEDDREELPARLKIILDGDVYKRQVIGVLSAWLQLNEVPSKQELIGMLLIAFALVIISAISIRKHQQVDAAQGQE